MKLTTFKDLIRYLFVILGSSDQRKHTYRWFRTAVFRGNYPLHAKMPSIVFDASDFTIQQLGLSPRVFEYGSGGSTLFWQELGATCVSIEHDLVWFALIKEHIGNSSKIDIRLIEPEKNNYPVAFDAADPALYLSAVPDLQGYNFKKYASEIDSYSDGYFDLVMIDGRARPSCIMHSARKVKSGGLLILDDADRLHYREKTKSYLESFVHRSFVGVGPCGRRMWRTDIYVKKL